MSVETLSVDTFSHLDQLLSPFYYGPELEIPPCPPGTLAVSTGLLLQSRLSQDCLWGYSFNGPVIRCFPIYHPNPILGRSHVPVTISTDGYHFPNSIINCAVELSICNERVEKGLRRLLLGLDTGDGRGCLVIFDTVKGHPLRFINTPTPVESVVMIRHFGSQEDPLLNEVMRGMEGIAGVGLGQGEFILVDLGLRELREELHNSKINFTKQSQEGNTFELIPVELDDPSFRTKRKEQLKQNKLMFLDSHNQDFPAEDVDFGEVDLFYYCDGSGDLIGRMRKSEVRVTAMAYVPAIGSIVIGFNFGSFQIWRMDTLQLEFSSPLRGEEGDGLGVTSFEFQTPVDDPRNFCYLWVLLKGTTTTPLSPAKVELFAMEYESRSTIDTLQIYTDLKNCVCKLGFDLEDSYLDEDGTNSIQSSPIRSRGLVRPLRMWKETQRGKETLLFVSWESSRPGHSYLGVFDLNQWYSAQTPSEIPIQTPTELSPFFASITFTSPGIALPLLDVRMIEGTFTRWHNTHLNLNIHQYPTSITFQAMCLSSRGTYTFEHFGIQEKAIRLIQKEGATLMMEPKQLREICSMVGLRPQLQLRPEYPIQGFTNKMEDQFYILTVLLESTRPALIVQMGNAWLDGSYEGVGLSLSLIFNWIKYFATLVRMNADSHWEILLNPQSSTIPILPPETNRFIHYSNFIWNQHKALLWTLLRSNITGTQDEEYDDVKFGVDKLVQYSGSLVMLHRARILPPSTHPSHLSTILRDYYEGRRQEIQTSLHNSQFIHPEEKGGHPLLIDYLIENLDEDFLRDEWGLGREEHFYPPKHPAHILNFFLGTWIHIPQKFIQRIIFYYMLDLIQNKTYGKGLRGDFESLISLSPEEQWRVEILWMIDHGELKEGVGRLSRSGVRIDDEKEGYPWAAALVLLAAQGQQRPVLKILQENNYPAKISRFAFSLAATLEPNHTPLLRSTVLGFWNDQPTFFKLLEMTDERGLLDSLILSEMYRSGSGVRREVENYLDSRPKTPQNQIRLLRLFISSRNLEQGISVYKIIQKEWRDRRVLTPVDRMRLEETEIGLKKLMILHQNTFGLNSTRKRENKQGGENKSLVGQIPSGSIHSSPLLCDGEFRLVPPQLRRLMEGGMEMKGGQTPLSPLQRFSGRVHRIQETSTQSTSPAEDKDSPLDQEMIEGGLLDLHQLLRTPPVRTTTRGGHITPLGSSGGSGDSDHNSHKSSIKKDNGLRKRLLRTRFLDLSRDLEDSPSHEIIDTGSSGSSEESPGGESGSTEPFSPQDNYPSPPSELNQGFEFGSHEDITTNLQLEEIPETGPIFPPPIHPSSTNQYHPYSDSRRSQEGDISKEFREIRESVIGGLLLEETEGKEDPIIFVTPSTNLDNLEENEEHDQPTTTGEDERVLEEYQEETNNLFPEGGRIEEGLDPDQSYHNSRETEEIPWVVIEDDGSFIPNPDSPTQTNSTETQVYEESYTSMELIPETIVCEESGGEMSLFVGGSEPPSLAPPSPSHHSFNTSRVESNESHGLETLEEGDSVHEEDGGGDGGLDDGFIMTRESGDEEETVNSIQNSLLSLAPPSPSHHSFNTSRVESKESHTVETLEEGDSVHEEDGGLDDGFMMTRESGDEEETVNSIQNSPLSPNSPKMPTLSPITQPSPPSHQSSTQTKSESPQTHEEERERTFGIVTRSRSRHLSDVTYLAEHERSFLGLSTVGHDGSNNSINISQAPARRNLSLHMDMPILKPHLNTSDRAKSEPRGGERGRRGSMTEPTQPIGRVTRSGSVPKSMDTSINTVSKRRGNKRSGKGEEDTTLGPSSTDSLNSSQLELDLSLSASSVEEKPRKKGGKKTGKANQQLNTSDGIPQSSPLNKTQLKKGKCEKKIEEMNPIGSFPEERGTDILEKPVMKGRRGRQQTEKLKGEDTFEECAGGGEANQLNQTIHSVPPEMSSSTPDALKPKRKTRHSLSSLQDPSTENATRAKSEEPSQRTPPPPKRRRSSSEGPDLDSSSFNQSFRSSGDEDNEGDTWGETSLGEGSLNVGRRRIFDYAPSLSTVLEVTESSSAGTTPVVTTPMTRIRRSLRSSMTSINEEQGEESGIEGEGAGGRTTTGKKRSRKSSSTTTIPSIQEDETDRSPPPEPRRTRLRLDPPDLQGEEKSDTPTNRRTSSDRVTGRKKRTPKTPTKST